MIQCTILSWTMLSVGIFEGTADWFIAAGVFAIASYLSKISEKGG